MALNEEGKAHLDGCIKRLREKLIDITRRNPLISFKHSERGAAYVRVVDENPDVLFRKLRDESMLFEPLPDPEREPADEKTAEFKLALERARKTDRDYLAALEALGDSEADEEQASELESRLRAQVRLELGLPKLFVAGRLNIQEYAKAHGFDPSYELQCDDGAQAAHLSDNKIRVLYTRSRLETRLRTIRNRAASHASELARFMHGGTLVLPDALVASSSGCVQAWRV